MTIPNHPFLAACRREKTPYTPVWLMRQAGRYMEEYRELRAKFSFLDLCKRPDLAAEITVTPVERLGVDAAILFADILLLLEPMGVGLEYTKEDGPMIQRPVRTGADVETKRFGLSTAPSAAAESAFPEGAYPSKSRKGRCGRPWSEGSPEAQAG